MQRPQVFSVSPTRNFTRGMLKKGRAKFRPGKAGRFEVNGSFFPPHFSSASGWTFAQVFILRKLRGCLFAGQQFSAVCADNCGGRCECLFRLFAAVSRLSFVLSVFEYRTFINFWNVGARTYLTLTLQKQKKKFSLNVRISSTWHFWKIHRYLVYFYTSFLDAFPDAPS